ncbi:MAG: 30S ribosomal protein S2 [candidate division SR1 bacterium]|jgi:ribosomal protein S2|nr:30S ribosomal protein S2 [candidate division SR1 bacterium]MBB1578828.1 30S ribosomal protein S2 [candidate division SR1 bacterium]MBF0931999.1 30S ribosomal protein S2 [candidate division SR1 bacterium]RKW21644.1 MAG: 30S ribosomal protein S2 [Candidatus Gracilibacteria bacterium]
MTVSVNQIVEAQAHIGTLKNEAHPKTSKYWSEVTNGVVVINPESVAQQLEDAKATIQKAKAAGKEILVVCEKKMYAAELEALAKKTGVSYLNYKVSGGFLTNFDTFKKRIDSINEMASFMESEAYAALTKKEQLVYKRNFDRANKVYKGVTNLKKRPELVIVVDGTMLSTLIDEVENLKGKLEAIVIAGTNFSRYWPENELVVTNINSYTSIDFVLNYLLS